MVTKVLFIGNRIAGDDGIGSRLYDELKDEPKLKDVKIIEAGVMGLDIISYFEETDRLIFVDAIHLENNKNIGDVILFSEDRLPKEVKVLSQHDFGLEQTLSLLRVAMPRLEKTNIIGIVVGDVKVMVRGLSKELEKNLGKIKDDVLNKIMMVVKSKK